MKKLILLLFIFCVGCYTTQNTTQEFNSKMNSWIGKSKPELLMTWGSPDIVFEDDNNEIFTYVKVKRIYTTYWGYLTSVRKYIFYIGENKIIYHWNYKEDNRQGY